MRRTKISTLFTENEIFKCIEELGFDAILKDLDNERKEESAYITITTDEDLEWYIYLGFTGTYFEEFEILSHLYTSENPHLEANNWHKNDHLSVVTVQYDEESGDPAYNNGYFTLEQKMRCVRGELPLPTFVEQSLLAWEVEFDELIAQLCPEIPAGDD